MHRWKEDLLVSCTCLKLRKTSSTFCLHPILNLEPSGSGTQPSIHLHSCTYCIIDYILGLLTFHSRYISHDNRSNIHPSSLQWLWSTNMATGGASLLLPCGCIGRLGVWPALYMYLRLTPSHSHVQYMAWHYCQQRSNWAGKKTKMLLASPPVLNWLSNLSLAVYIVRSCGCRTTGYDSQYLWSCVSYSELCSPSVASWSVVISCLLQWAVWPSVTSFSVVYFVNQSTLCDADLQCRIPTGLLYIVCVSVGVK